MASDRRPYIKLPDSVADEPWDDATLADMVRLQLYLNTRWARHRLKSEEAGRAFLGPQTMMRITRTTNVTRARARLLALPERTAGVSIAVEEASQGRDRGVIVKWPRFPKEQGYKDIEKPQNGGESGASAPPPLMQTQTLMKKQPRKRKKEPVSLCPDSLTASDLEKLFAWGAEHGFSQAECRQAFERVRDWSQTGLKKKTRWWTVVKNAMQDGWALKNREPPRRLTFAEEQQQRINETTERLLNESD